MTPALEAARDSAAVFLLPDRTHIEITGADRAAFLHNFCTNDIKSLQPGQGCEAFLCNVKGHVVGHATVFVGDEAIWLETVPGAAQKLIAHLERYVIREDVELRDRTHQLLELCIVGPRAAEVLFLIGGPTSLEEMPVPGTLRHSGTMWIDCIDWFGGRSYLVSGDPSEIRPFHGVLSEFDQIASAVAGTARGVAAGTAADWEALRIDAGFPTYGVDITEDNLPQEVARNQQCLSFTKGCYLGQEPVARLDALGHTNRELRRLLIHGSAVPAHGTGLIDPASGNDAGHVTSAAPNPYGDGVLALGYVKSKWFAAGTLLHLATDAKHAVNVR